MDDSAILARLRALADPPYAAFQRKLLPTVSGETVIGVRTPALRALARSISGTLEAEAFLLALPHAFFDENQLHAFLIAQERDFARCVARVDAFLPYVDNWATCDQLSPVVFRRRRGELLPWVEKWLSDGWPYTVRFAVGMLMRHYLDDAFDPRYPGLVAAIRSDEYYVNMMIAWYFATALAKRYEDALPYLAVGRLAPWTRDKAIQKALESNRVAPAHKEALQALRRSRGPDAQSPRPKEERPCP